jgi:dTDP-3-amino-3,4,6-trideoxy-alpha-D-glucose transaminase
MSPPQVRFMDVAAAQADIAAELQEATARVAASGWYLLGPELEAFEREFAAYCGVAHCVGVGSGLSALELTLRGLGIGPGDEVLVPAYTFVATWLAVSAVGATPVGVDVDPATYNLDVEAAAAAVGEKTAAIVPVHLRGEPADMDAVAELAARHGLAVLEDAAQAHGARHRGCRVGGLGAAAAFSFYPAKNLGAFGDGGAVTTDDAALADRVRLLRNYGMRTRYEVEAVGMNSRLAEIQAAVLRVKLGRLDVWNDERRGLAGTYLEELATLDQFDAPEAQDWAEPVWHLFAVGHDDRAAARDRLAAAGIETQVHYPTLPHLSAAYGGDGAAGRFPIAERLSARELSLPLYPNMGEEAVAATLAALSAAS